MLRIPLFSKRREADVSTDTAPRRMMFYRHSRREVFTNPLPSNAKIAVLASFFAERNGVRCFEPEAVAEICAFAPQIVAGSVHALLRLAPDVGKLRALVVFSGARVGEVTARDRDLLWAAFQVPVFEQRLAQDGSVIARECEAHDGLHVTSPALFEGQIRPEPCECGKSEVRIDFTRRGN